MKTKSMRNWNKILKWWKVVMNLIKKAQRWKQQNHEWKQ